MVENPSKLPPSPALIEKIEEPMVERLHLHPARVCRGGYGAVPAKRGIYENLTYLESTRVKIEYIIPLAEIIYDFFGRP